MHHPTAAPLMRTEPFPWQAIRIKESIQSETKLVWGVQQGPRLVAHIPFQTTAGCCAAHGPKTIALCTSKLKDLEEEVSRLKIAKNKNNNNFKKPRTCTNWSKRRQPQTPHNAASRTVFGCGEMCACRWESACWVRR